MKNKEIEIGIRNKREGERKRRKRK